MSEAVTAAVDRNVAEVAAVLRLLGNERRLYNDIITLSSSP